MQQRISLITLGARDMTALGAFYERLGWERVKSPDGVIAFDLLGQTLGLFPVEKLAEDIGVPVDSLGHGAIALAHNLPDRGGVEALMARAQAAGARVLKPATASFWGGFHGYFADPEGHVWEIAHNPFSPLGPDGAFRWNGFGQG
jgi:catechol 2,3-dioxygenase-like lactoylglutathione lyase family enzyme